MQPKRFRMGVVVVGLCLLTGGAAIGQRVVTDCNERGERLVPDVPPGIVLLKDYQHERCMGRDSSKGRIWKNQGLEIRYEGGLGTGNRVEQNRSNLVWSREHTTDTNRAQIAMTNSRELLVTFSALPGFRTPMLNFYATIRSEEDIADALLMVMGYQAQSVAIGMERGGR
jgi:hypothetical protein